MLNREARNKRWTKHPHSRVFSSKSLKWWLIAFKFNSKFGRLRHKVLSSWGYGIYMVIITVFSSALKYSCNKRFQMKKTKVWKTTTSKLSDIFQLILCRQCKGKTSKWKNWYNNNDNSSNKGVQIIHEKSGNYRMTSQYIMIWWI